MFRWLLLFHLLCGVCVLAFFVVCEIEIIVVFFVAALVVLGVSVSISVVNI